jgi:hypothetical protein
LKSPLLHPPRTPERNQGFWGTPSVPVDPSIWTQICDISTLFQKSHIGWVPVIVKLLERDAVGVLPVAHLKVVERATRSCTSSFSSSFNFYISGMLNLIQDTVHALLEELNGTLYTTQGSCFSHLPPHEGMMSHDYMTPEPFPSA